MRDEDKLDQDHNSGSTSESCLFRAIFWGEGIWWGVSVEYGKWQSRLISSLLD